MQHKKDNTAFNIRKVYKKNSSVTRNPQEAPFYSPQIQFQKSHQPLTYTNSKKQKQLILDQTANQAILNSKTYIDLKRAYQQNKKKNNERINQLNEGVVALKNQKRDIQDQKDRVKTEKRRVIEAIQETKRKIGQLREENQRKRQNAHHLYQSQAQYFNELLLSMRFQAEYQHNIDPDQMTYEELLELQEKIGSVSKGLPEQAIQTMIRIPVRDIHIQSEQKCTVCYCNFQIQEIMTQLVPCKHQFHFDCLKTWLLKEKVCPLCKQQIRIQAKQFQSKNGKQ